MQQVLELSHESERGNICAAHYTLSTTAYTYNIKTTEHT